MKILYKKETVKLWKERMDFPCSEQLWVGCCASGRHKPWGSMQPCKIIKLPLQTFSLWFCHVLLQRGQWYKWMKAMLWSSNILTHSQPRFKGANWTEQPRTSSEFSGHGSCANKGWQKSAWSAAEPKHTLASFASCGGIAWEHWEGNCHLSPIAAAKNRNSHLQRGWNTSLRQDLTWPGVTFSSAHQYPSHQMGCAAALEWWWHGMAPQWC